MRNIFKTTLILISVALTVSCMDEIYNPVSDNPQEGNLVEMTFTASFGEETRTVLDGTDVLWLPDDEIAINEQRFTTDIDAAASSADFSGMVEETTYYYAIYPYSAVQSLNDGIYTISLPEVQKAHKGSFADGVNISVTGINGSLQDQTLDFINVLGYVKFSIDESVNNVKSLTVRSNNGYAQVWGTTARVMAWNIDPWLHIDGNSGMTSVKLEADGFFEPGTYYIAICPETFYGGLSFDFENEDGYIATLSIKQDVELKAGEIKNIGLMKNLNFKPSPEMRKAAEREALIALYESTDGENWTYNDNWCTDMPLSDWHGVTLNNEGFVEMLNLENNNLKGELPDKISDLKALQILSLSWNSLEGDIPESICELEDLSGFLIKQNRLTGGIPSKIGSLPLISLDVTYNSLTGNIPESIADIMNENLNRINLNHNNLSGEVPAEIIGNEYFNEHWINMIYQNEGYVLDVSDARIKAPIFETTDIDGSAINSAEIYSNNEYTVLFAWDIGCGFSMAYMPVLKSWYDEYKSSGVEVIAYSGNTLSNIQSVVASNALTWKNFKLEQFSELFTDYNYFSDAPISPFVAVVDKDGYIVHNPINDNRDDIIKLFEDKWGDLGGSEDEKYESQDKSQDGTVGTLQTASEGNGINIVLMGDGYSDRQIERGDYLTDITNAYNAFFSVEPYSNYKEFFNVYYVIAVSDNEGFAEGNSTVFEGQLSDAGSAVSGNDATVFEYTKKAVSEEKMDETLTIVVMNDLRYGGTCVMYSDPASTGDWGSGAAIAYLPLSSSSAHDTFAQVIHHEAGGHGFAKLADEYWSGNDTITDEAKADYVQWMTGGFFKNVDFTNSQTEVKWAKFLADDNYANDGLGLFEGGLAYYAYGVYRPTEESIMRFNVGGFNAPSREAIYYRIHKLAYGADWEYDYEKFVEYDAINRKSPAQAQTAQKRRANYVERTFEPTHPPVIVKGSWRDAVK